MAMLAPRSSICRVPSSATVTPCAYSVIATRARRGAVPTAGRAVVLSTIVNSAPSTRCSPAVTKPFILIVSQPSGVVVMVTSFTAGAFPHVANPLQNASFHLMSYVPTRSTPTSDASKVSGKSFASASRSAVTAWVWPTCEANWPWSTRSKRSWYRAAPGARPSERSASRSSTRLRSARP